MAFVTVWTLRPPDPIVNTGPAEIFAACHDCLAVNPLLPPGAKVRRIILGMS